MSFSLSIDHYSHGCRIYNYESKFLEVIADFLEGLKLIDAEPGQFGQIEMVTKKVFFGLTHDRRNLFLHRHHLDGFLQLIREWGYDDSVIKHNYLPVPEARSLTVRFRKGITPRDYQIPIVNSLSNDSYSNALYLRTGGGKSISTLLAVERVGKRFAIMIPPKYFGLWEGTLYDAFGRKKIEHKYKTADGSPKFKALIQQALDGKLKADCIMISNATYRAFLNNFEEFGEEWCLEEYGCTPTTFHEVMGIGVQINDEIQEDPGLYFRIDLYSNVRKIINLSATPFTGSDYVTEMINVMLPEETHCPLPEYDIYQDVIALLYNDIPVKPKDYLVPHRGMYSHMRYESQMLKNRKRFDSYVRKIIRVVDAVFVKEFQPKQKILILCATRNFIDALTVELKQEYGNRFNVGPYYQGISYNKLMRQDITISTAKSSGTGVDIPNLKEVMLLHAMNSKKDNIQILGRLRPLKDFPEITPRMVYFVCVDIQHQLAYHRNKKSYFHGKVKSHRTLRL